MKHLGKRLLAAGLTAAMVIGSVGAISAATTSIECGSFWTKFSDGYALASGDELTISYTNTTSTSATGNYCTPLTVLFSENDTSSTALFVGRSDAYAWSGDSWTNYNTSGNVASGVSSITYTTPALLGGWLDANKEGMEYTVTAVKSDNVVTLTVRDETGRTSTATVTLSSDADMYLALTGEACTLSSISVDGVEMADVECASWWTAFSAGIKISSSSTKVTFTSTSYDTATAVYQTPSFVLYSASSDYDNTTAAILNDTYIDDYSEYLVLRSDYYAWSGAWNTNDTTGSYNSSNISSMSVTSTEVCTWDGWLAANKEGLGYTITAKNESGVITITAKDEYGVSSTAVITLTEVSSTPYLFLSGESCTLSDIKATYTVSSDGVVEFLGGSLRKDDSEYTSTGLRFGYTITLPDGVSAEDLTWSWAWGTDDSSLTGTVTGANYVNNNDGTITTNLVITEIPSTDYKTTIYSQLTVSYEVDGVTYTLTDDVQSRTVQYVANAINSNDSASTSDKTYCTGILAKISE